MFRIGHLGDTIVSLPALWSIREAFPDAHLALLSNAEPDNPEYVAARSVLPATGLFDDWIVYSNTQESIRKLRAFSRLYKKLRGEKFDAAFYLMPRIRSASSIRRDVMFLKSTGIKKVFGADFLSRNLIDPGAAKPLPHIVSEGDFLVELVNASGIKASARGCDISLSAEEKDAAIHWLSENCGSGFSSRKLLALAPGSKWQSKIWHEKNYVSVVSRLVKAHGVFPVVFGGAEDGPIGDRILKEVGAGANAAGKLGIREGTASMKYAELYLGNDTGTMHMAAAAGIPCVAIFAAIDFPGRWYPHGAGHTVFRVPVECEGCHTPDCFNSYLCLESVSAGEVFAACERAMGC